MDFLDLIFKIIENFIRLEDGKLEKLRQEAKAWQMTISSKTAPSQLEKFFIKYNDLWYVKTGLALASLFIIRYISDMLTKPYTVDEYEDEENENHHNNINQNSFGWKKI